MACLAFMECAAHVRLSDRFSQREAVVGAAKHLELTLCSADREVHRSRPLPVKAIISLELYVCSGRPAFMRAFAWYRLFRTWAVLRMDDTKGIPPATVRMGQYVLSASLVRSKTTGPGRKVGELPVVVDRTLSLSGLPWLLEGYKLWRSEPFSFARDYFLPRASEDFEKPISRMASYADAAGYSRALLGDLPDVVARSTGTGFEEVSRKLFSPAGVAFWTEHSDRKFLPTHAAAFGVEKSRRDFCGRWRPDASDDYVASAQNVVAGVQREVAKAFGGADTRLDEGELFAAYGAFLVEQANFSEEEAKGFVQRLVLDSPMRWALAEVWAEQEGDGASGPGRRRREISQRRIIAPSEAGSERSGTGRGEADTSSSSGEPAASEGPSPAALPSHAAPEGDDEVPQEQSPAAVPIHSAPEGNGVVSDTEPAEEAPFWISITGNRRWRRLHKVGGCGVVPGRRALNFEWCSGLRGVAADDFCRRCWPLGAPWGPGAEAEQTATSGSEESDASSSSSDSGSTAVAEGVAAPG